MTHQETASGPANPLGVAMIGYAFMGKAHSNAWRNVASYFDVPAFEQKVLAGRDETAVAAAAANNATIQLDSVLVPSTARYAAIS